MKGGAASGRSSMRCSVITPYCVTTRDDEEKEDLILWREGSLYIQIIRTAAYIAYFPNCILQSDGTRVRRSAKKKSLEG